MVKLEKIVCFIFTLFIVYLVNKQCLVEGIINLNSFTNCIDDPQWYTLDKDGKKNYCKDIGTSASCYDMDPLQQEGWERCLETCGNCANTSVTIAPMDNSALYSGGTGEDFDRVDIDDSRKWLGLGVGDEDTMDVRESLTRDEEDDIVNIFDRLETVEDLYDMLLGSISSCFDCSKLSESDCISESKCEYTDGKCSAINPGNESFISCNGSELSCDYTIKDIKDDDDSDDTTNTVNINSTNIVRTYVKQKCETDGECSILFPTYEFSCDNIPDPDSSRHEYNTLDYQPRPAEETQDRWCLKPAYYADNNVTQIVDLMNTINIQFNELNRKIRNSVEIRNIIETKDNIFNSINTIGTIEDITIKTDRINELPTAIVSLNSDLSRIILSNSDNLEISNMVADIIANLTSLEPLISGLTDDISDKIVIYNNNITPFISSNSSNDCLTDITTGITNANIVVNDNNTIYVRNQDDDSTNVTDWAEEGLEIPLLAKTGASEPKYCMSGITISNIDNGELTLNSTPINIINNLMNIPSEGLNINNVLTTLSSPDGSTAQQITNDDNNNLLNNIQDNCLVNKRTESNIINKCYKVNIDDSGDDDNKTTAKEACIDYCIKTTSDTNYISLNDDNHCRCFVDLPLSGTDATYASIIDGDSCSAGSYELLDKGRITSVEHLPTAVRDANKEMIKHCKSYFLLEKALTEQDIPDDDENRQDKLDNIDNMKDRISLYDVCPTQCKAVSCV